MNEKLISVGEKILDQLAWETDIGTLDKSIGYFEGVIEKSESKKWILRNEKTRSSNFIRDIHGCAIGTEDGQNDTIYTRANTVYRDSPLGRLLVQGVGCHSHKTPKGETISIDIDVLSKYLTNGRGDAINGEIAFRENNQEFKFSSLIKDLGEIKRLENAISDEEERLKNLQKETEEAKALINSIEQKEQKISNLRNKVQKHIVKEVALRDQPLLDKYQEDVKRSKILDGSLIINGGPGTGKTTSLIQRINYLTSPTIEEEIGELNKEQQDVLYNSNSSWVFYSPTELLKSYLESAMEDENLLGMKENVRTWENHRKVLLRQTGLINADKGRPSFIFKTIKSGTFFKQSYAVYETINDLFLDYLLERQTAKVIRLNDEQVFTKLSKKHEDDAVEEYRANLMKLGLKMRDNSRSALKYRKIESWVPFFISFNADFADEFKAINTKLNKDIKLESGKLQVKINNNPELLNWLTQIIQEELKNKNAQVTEDEDEEDEDEELIDVNENVNLDILMIRKLIRFVRNIALQTIDGKNTKVSVKNKVLLERLEPFLNSNELASLGIRLYFKKYFEKPTRGLETNLLSEIPGIYKQFRKTIYKDNNECLSSNGLAAFDKNLKNENKFLFEEEADYLLSFIFRICKRIFRDRKQYFKESSHQYLLTFKNNIKGVVAIDEATDFSIWELSAMSNLSHPLFNSVTLSGDLMQRLTEKGICSWTDYTKLYPKTEIRDLKIAYRQTAKLLKIASEIYSWNVDSPANFKSHFPDDPLDPSPLVFVDADEEEKHQWLVQRIIEIQKLYGTEFPSVAIFVKDDMEVVKLADALKEYEALEEIGVDVVPCVLGKILGNKQSVRVYSIEYIKGLEFGAVFFHNLDDLSLHDDTLTNKYIYVGLSRANLFLGVTMNEEFNEDLQFLNKHFVKGNWQDYSKGNMDESDNIDQQ
jgi:hypothetical protein